VSLMSYRDGKDASRDPRDDDAACWPISMDLVGLRARVQVHAARAGLTGAQQQNLVLAVNEAATNVLDHVEGQGHVRVRCDTDYLTVDVVDDAGTLDPIDEWLHPGPYAVRGYGLWIITQICDDVAVSNKDGHTRVRLRMRRNAA
jgi:serine/threonine-protein kinase RsbW